MAGTGFRISDNLIATNCHIVPNRKDIVITRKDKSQSSGRSVYYDERQDICIIWSDRSNSSFLLIKKDDYSVNLGQEVIAIGHPHNLDYSVSRGIISGKNREIAGNIYYQTDTAINEGNSGGPLLNLEGHVVGMVTLKRIDSQGINFVIPGYILFNVFEAVVKALTTGSTLCAVCQKLISTEDEYCPNCGAQMDSFLPQHQVQNSSVLTCAVCGSVADDTLSRYCSNCGSDFTKQRR
jgi:serine protease Do